MLKYLSTIFLSVFLSLCVALPINAQVSGPNFWKNVSGILKPLTQSWGLDFTNSTITSTRICFTGDICRTTWPTGGGGGGTSTPSGSNGDVQTYFNGAFGSSPFFNFNSSTNVLSVTNVSSSAVTSSVLASTPSQPFLVSTLTSSTIMAQSYSVFVSGNYAYMVSLVGDSLTIIDVSNQATPKIIGVLTDASNLNGARNVYVAGKYAYVANQDDNSLAIVDVSNPSAPVLTGKVKDNSLLNRAYFVNVAGQYAYVIANADNSMRVIDISSSTNPQIIGGIKDNTNLAGAYGMNVNGRYAYVVAGTDNSLRVIDLINPASPVIVGGIKDSSLLTAARAVYVSGRYAYVTAFNTSTLAIIDVSNPATTTPIVGYLRDTVNLNGVRSVTVQDGYAYVGAATNNSIDIIDISSSTNPQLVQVLKDSTNLNIPHGIYVVGDYLYAAMNTTTNPNFSIVGLNGLTAATANLGALKVSTINVQDDGVFNRNVVIYSGLNVGDRGINSSGNFTGLNLMLSGSGTSTNFYASGLTFINGNGTSITSTNGNITTLTFGTAVGTSVTSTNGNFSGLTFTTLSGTDASTTNLFLSGAFSQTGFIDCNGGNKAVNYTLAGGAFGCTTITGGTSTGTVSITNTLVAFGDANNQVASSTNFSFTTSTNILQIIGTVSSTNGLLFNSTSTNIYSNGSSDFTSTTFRATTSDGSTNGYSVLDSSGVPVLQVNSDGDIIGNLTGASVILGGLTVDRSYAGLWLGQTSPNATNYLLLGNSQQTFINAPNSGVADIEFRIGNGTEASIGSNGLAVGLAGNTSPTYPFQVHTTPFDFTILSTGLIGVNTTTASSSLFFVASTTPRGGIFFGETGLYRSNINELTMTGGLSLVNATSTNLRVGTLLSYASANGTSITSTNISFTNASGTTVTTTNFWLKTGTMRAPASFSMLITGGSSLNWNNADFTPSTNGTIDLGTIAQSWKRLVSNEVSSTNVTSSLLKTSTFSASIRSVSTDQTLNPTSTDFTILVDASGANRTINLPNTASTTVGRIFNIKKTDSSGNSVFIDGFASQTIDGNTVRTSTVQYTNVQIQSDGTNWQVL